MNDERLRILVDINVFIDIIEKRRNWEDSLAAIDVIERKHEGFVSALTKVILYFRRARITSDKNARNEAKDILEHFKLVAMDDSVLDAAFSDEQFDDVEDAIQFHSAIKVANIIITRNKRDYEEVAKKISIVTPEEFLKKYELL